MSLAFPAGRDRPTAILKILQERNRQFGQDVARLTDLHTEEEIACDKVKLEQSVKAEMEDLIARFVEVSEWYEIQMVTLIGASLPKSSKESIIKTCSDSLEIESSLHKVLEWLANRGVPPKNLALLDVATERYRRVRERAKQTPIGLPASYSFLAFVSLYMAILAVAYIFGSPSLASEMNAYGLSLCLSLIGLSYLSDRLSRAAAESGSVWLRALETLRAYLADEEPSHTLHRG
jgi:hypothetical protein